MPLHVAQFRYVARTPNEVLFEKGDVVRVSLTTTFNEIPFPMPVFCVCVCVCTRVLHPLRFLKLEREDTAGIGFIALVSMRADDTNSSSAFLSGNSFYADMRNFNENSC